MDLLGKFNGVVLVAPKKKNTGMIRREHRWVLPTREYWGGLVLDPLVDGVSWEKGFGDAGGTNDPEQLELSETILFVCLWRHLVEDFLEEHDGMP